MTHEDDFPYDTRVWVEDAPGYATFQGSILATLDAVDDRGDLAFIEAVWADETHTVIVPLKYVHKSV